MATDDQNPKPAKAKSKDPLFKVVDLRSGSTTRQIRTPNSDYETVQMLQIKLTPIHGRLSLEEVLVLCVQAGAVALTGDLNAPRTLSPG